MTLPPGRLRLATRPYSTGSPPMSGRRWELSMSRPSLPAPGRHRRTWQSPRRGGRPGPPLAPAAGRADLRPSDTRSLGSGPRHNRLLFRPWRRAATFCVRELPTKRRRTEAAASNATWPGLPPAEHESEQCCAAAPPGCTTSIPTAGIKRVAALFGQSPARLSSDWGSFCRPDPR